MSVTIRIDARATIASIDAAASSQIPFALAKSITQTGLDFQKAERAHFKQVFFERRADFLEKQGVKLIGGIATKAKPSITFGVDPKADFLVKFEAGGLKKPRSGPFLALPTDARRNKRDIITAGNRPKALVSRLGDKKGAGGVFLINRISAITTKSHLPPGLYQRTGRGGRNLKLLFAFEPDAQIPKTLDFVSTFQQTVQKNWQKNFSTALADAIRTAK